MLTIKFSRCPIGKHKGERWAKLSRIDTKKPLILTKVISGIDGLYSPEFIQNDTFPDFTPADFNKLLEEFYGDSQIHLLVLFFKQGDVEITTIRAYDWRKHIYYKKNIGCEYMVKEEEIEIEQKKQEWLDAIKKDVEENGEVVYEGIYEALPFETFQKYCKELKLKQTEGDE